MAFDLVMASSAHRRAAGVDKELRRKGTMRRRALDMHPSPMENETISIGRYTQADRQIVRQADRQIVRQTDR